MTESILDSVKKVLGVDKDYDAFDIDILMHINSVFSTLHQLGVGPADGFFIDLDEPRTPEWSDFLEGKKNINSVKTYVYLSVRLLFDPPTTSFAITAMENQKKELEWRLNVATESPGVSATPATSNFWDITGMDDFPEGARPGDLGVDLVTGDVWRNE